MSHQQVIFSVTEFSLRRLLFTSMLFTLFTALTLICSLLQSTLLIQHSTKRLRLVVRKQESTVIDYIYSKRAIFFLRTIQTFLIVHYLFVVHLFLLYIINMHKHYGVVSWTGIILAKFN